MKTYLYNLTQETLKKSMTLKEQKAILNSKSVLVQIFSSQTKEKTEEIAQEVLNKIPHAFIVASSTDGEIQNTQVNSENTVVSISTFDKTNIKNTYLQDENSFQLGQNIAKKLITQKTKLLLSFIDGISVNSTEYLKGIYSIDKNIKIAGGVAAFKSHTEECFVGIQDKVFFKGAVAVALESDVLYVESIYKFGWERLGLAHTITKVKKNRVYTIDGLKSIDFYSRYLGNYFTNSLPASGLEFPLISQEDDSFNNAKVIVQKHNDGSLTFSGDLSEGEKVFLGMSKASSSFNRLAHNFKATQAESFFIYSCIVRKWSIPVLIDEELKPLSQIAPTSGFFTFGEFYVNNRSKLLHETLAAVALSENRDDKKSSEQRVKREISEEYKTFHALQNFMQETIKDLNNKINEKRELAHELKEKNNNLERMQNLAHLGNWEFDLKTNQFYFSQESAKIFHLNLKDNIISYKKFLSMIVPEDRKKIDEFKENIFKHDFFSFELQMKREDGENIFILDNAKVIYKNKKILKIIGIILDITELRLKDSIIVKQSHLAQMGEMINMIAHQWRQPLNAISSAAIKLNMQNDLQLLDENSIKETTTFIQEQTQNMSQTINDFMNFSKPEYHKEYTNVKESVEYLFQLLDGQLKTHNIDIELNMKDCKGVFLYKKELEHVLLNLISNAKDALLEAKNRDKKIVLNIEKKDKDCYFVISDNAGGIPLDIIDRVFEPYFTTKKDGRGTGLGLYMSKKLLKEHLNGEISCKNSKEGAIFTVVVKESVYE